MQDRGAADPREGARLSTDVEGMSGAYDVVVVGSGYGGGVAAARLSRAGQRVCVLERGCEIQPGGYPATELEAAAQVQVDVLGHRAGRETALFDMHVEQDMVVLVGCGLGGTSLINANVAIEPDLRVFEDQRWPAGVRSDLAGLHAGMDRARRTLGARPYPLDQPALTKLGALGRVGERLGIEVERPDLYVTFEDGVNASGVEQRACTLCGDCVSGCNHRAKNTVLMNYLPDAHNHGAEIFCETSVRWVERGEPGTGKWRVRFEILGAGRRRWGDSPPLAVEAETVVLAAGTLGSTEILLRSRDRGLPLSPELGRRFTANGDVLAFAYDTDGESDSVGYGTLLPPGRRRDPDVAPVGPCITGVLRHHDDDLTKSFVIEDGSIPGSIAGLVSAGLALAAVTEGGELDHGAGRLAEQVISAAEGVVLGPRHGALERTLVYLGMSFDDGEGVLSLVDDRVRLRWPGVGGQADASEVDDALRSGSAALGGVFVRDPLWSSQLGHRLVSVHPLGGCVMGTSSEDGVVDHLGRVFTSDGAEVHPGLHVMDGSMVPSPLGVNPSLTITALAERNVARLAANAGWVIDGSTSIPAPPGARPAQAVGVEFTEVMHGLLSAPPGAAQQDRAPGESRFEITVLVDDIDALVADPGRPARFAGVVTLPPLSIQPITVTGGELQLRVPDPDAANVSLMVYRMVLRDGDGRDHHLHGLKTLRDGSVEDLWSQTTTLQVAVTAGSQPGGPVELEGVMTLTPADFLRQMSTIRAVGAATALDGLRARVRFGRWFAAGLWESYGGMFAGESAVDPAAPPRRQRPLRVPPPTPHTAVTDDGVPLRLTRYRAGTKGPVILAHGLGVSSQIFAVDTIDTSLVEHLVEQGFDVWLLDYRTSVALPSAGRPATADQIATSDWPAAVSAVLDATGAGSVEVVAHCFGAVTFLMAMLSGLQGIRSAVCSQIGVHFVTPGMTRLKAGLHLPGMLEHLGIGSLTTYASEHERWSSALYDHALRVLPVPEGESCRSAVCHRITFLYGLLYQHAQLRTATHDSLHELFGVADVAALEHLAAMVRAGHVVDAHGRDTYLRHVDRLALPLSFVHGAANECYRPESTERTLRWLSEANGPDWYDRRLIDGHGHLDCIFGHCAAKDVFGYITDRLEPYASE